MNWNVIDKINTFTKELFHTQRFILRKKFLQKISMDNNSFLSVLLCLRTYFYEYIFFFCKKHIMYYSAQRRVAVAALEF